MRILSATDAVSPAIARTKLVLFSPFHWARTWRVSASAYISNMGTVFIPFPLLVVPFLPLIRQSSPAWVMWVVLAGAVLLMALLYWVFALTSRLQFAVFDVVLNRAEKIAPPWRKYALQARRWSNFKILAGTAVTVVLGFPLALYVRLTFVASPPRGVPAAFFLLLVLFYGSFALLMLAASLLNDFMMPSLALEDTTIEEAWRRVAELARREPGQVALYALLKVVLGCVAQMALGIVFEIAFFLAIAILAVVGFLFGLILHALGVPDNILSGLATTLMILFLPVIMFYWMPMATGIAMTFLEAYKLYFLGGSYPMLGELLKRSTPYPRYASYAPATHITPDYPSPVESPSPPDPPAPEPPAPEE